VNFFTAFIEDWEGDGAPLNRDSISSHFRNNGS